MWILSNSGECLKYILYISDKLLVGHISDRIFHSTSQWCSVSGCSNMWRFTFAITFTREIHAKWASRIKSKFFSLFLPIIMQARGIDFINTTLLEVESSRFIIESDPSRIDTSRYSSSLFRLWVLMILLITPFILLISYRPTIIILFFLPLKLPSIIVSIILLIFLLATLQFVRPSKIPTRIFPDLGKKITPIWSSEWFIRINSLETDLLHLYEGRFTCISKNYR